MIRILRLVALLCVAGMIAVACSGGSSTEPTEADVASVQATTTVEVDPLPAATSSTTTTSTTTTTEPLGPVAQLTGLPVEAELTHPAVVVKIDNHQNARPQWGLNAADIELCRAKFPQIETHVGNIARPLNVGNLVQGVQLRGQAAVHTNNLFVNNGHGRYPS